MVIACVALWNTRAAKPARRLERYDDGLAQEVVPCSTRIFASRQCLSSALQWRRAQRHNRIKEVGDRRPGALLLQRRRRMRRRHRTQPLHRTSPRLPRMPHPLRTLRHRGPRLPHIPAPAAPRHAPPAAAPRHAQAPRAVPQQSARPRGGPATSAMARHAPPKAAAPAQPQVSGRNARGRGNAKVAQPNQQQNLTRPGGPDGASTAAPSPRGGRNAARQQTVAPQQGTTGQNQTRSAAAPSAQQNAASRQQAVIPQNQVNQIVPPSASRARAASNPRAFSGGVLRNQAFANLASARDPGARTLANSTFQGRFFNPQWRRHSAFPIVIGWIGPLFWPYAYDDFVDYTFYPYAYDTFWPYAYDDFYDGMFGAYALGYGGTYASVGPSGGDGGGYARSGSARSRYARGSAGGARNIEADLCSGQT